MACFLPDAPAATARRQSGTIVARDPDTGELGAAVQSHWFAVGAVVIHAEAEIGALATQAFVDPGYGPLGLDLMRAGRSAPEAMARAFEATTGDLAHRILAALDAAETEGGDIRGRQSAALLMVRGKSSRRPWADKLFDVRVDDHPEPLPELRRLVDVRRAYAAKDTADAAFARGDLETGNREYERAQALAPRNSEFSFWHGIGMLALGRIDDAVRIMRPVFARDRNWATLALRMVGSPLIPGDEHSARDAIAKAQTRG